MVSLGPVLPQQCINTSQGKFVTNTTCMLIRVGFNSFSLAASLDQAPSITLVPSLTRLEYFFVDIFNSCNFVVRIVNKVWASADLLLAKAFSTKRKSL